MKTSIPISNIVATLAISAVVAAETPDRPITLLEHSDFGRFTTEIDASMFEGADLKLTLMRSGHIVAEQKRQLDFDSGHERSRHSINGLANLAEQSDGIFTQIIRVRAKHRHQDNRYTFQHFIYFEKSNGELRRLNMKDYSDKLNPLQSRLLANGELESFYAGDLGIGGISTGPIHEAKRVHEHNAVSKITPTDSVNEENIEF